MAEPTHAPALPSTADTTPYVPVSWMAVAADAVAGLYAGLLLILGITAFTNKKPLVIEELLVLPVIAVVLSFAARRMIRNSEGTRTGEQLANGAWWTALVLGLGYATYLGAISFAVRRDASTAVELWVGLVRDEKTELAFYQTLPPGARQGIAKTDTQLLQARFRDELLQFRTSDLVRLAQRNPGEFAFTPTGVSGWEYKPGTIDCSFTGTVKCPEGTFPVLVSLKGVEGVAAGDGGRQWMVVRPPAGGFIQQDKAARTLYGWLVLMLELDGGAFGRTFVEHASSCGPGGHPYLYHAFVATSGEVGGWSAVARSPLLQFVFAAPLGATHPGAYAEYLAKSFYKLPGGGEPDAGQRNKFLASWNALGLFEAGRRLKDPAGGVPDKENVLKITDSVIELHIPVELPIQNATGKPETARGRLVVACKDPALLAEVRDRKAAAKGEKPSATPPEELTRKTPIPWRVVRIESDMNAVSAHQPSPGGPGGPPGGRPSPGHGGG